MRRKNLCFLQDQSFHWAYSTRSMFSIIQLSRQLISSYRCQKRGWEKPIVDTVCITQFLDLNCLFKFQPAASWGARIQFCTEPCENQQENIWTRDSPTFTSSTLLSTFDHGGTTMGCNLCSLPRSWRCSSSWQLLMFKMCNILVRKRIPNQSRLTTWSQRLLEWTGNRT